MDLQSANGTSAVTVDKTTNVQSQNGSAKISATAKSDQETAKPAAASKAANEGKPIKPSATQESKTSIVIPAKAEFTLNDRLKVVNDLHRKSVQRLNLLTRIKQLEEFEVALAQENDELEDNPYQGCRLIIEDDKNRKFVTTTPGLIRMVSQFIFEACNKKLSEIEETILFPNS